MDLISQLPKPNLNSISTDITDGESFIRWLENGNEITYEVAKDICKSLEGHILFGESEDRDARYQI